MKGAAAKRKPTARKARPRAAKASAPAALTRLEFVGEIVQLDEGVRLHILPVPDAIATVLKRAKVRRMLCTLNGQELKRALQNHADGGSFLVIGQPTLRNLGFKRGTRVSAVLRADPAPDALEMPEELALVFADDASARERWETFTVGFRRSLLHYVTSAKLEPTRIKRALELAQKIRTHTLHSDRRT